MPYNKKVKDLMIPLEDYPHIPYWFTLRQAMAIVREAAVKFEGSFEPRAVLVFDEKYQLMGILTLGDIGRGLFLMIKEDVGLVAVMEGVKVAGMLRLSDLFVEISRLVLGD